MVVNINITNRYKGSNFFRKNSHLNAEPPIFWHHIGLYAYRREFLTWFASQPPSQLEQLEKLEQLRAIEAGKQSEHVRSAV